MKKKAGVQAAVVSHEGGGDLMINVLNGTLDFGIGENDAMGKILVDRCRARVEIAKLRVALLEDPSNVPSPFDQMQLQLDQLADHVLDLLDQLENPDTIIPQP